MSPDRPAAVVVLAAGEGTRMKSSIPKVLHTVGGRTLVGHVVAAAERPRARPPGRRGRARPRPGRRPPGRGRPGGHHGGPGRAARHRPRRRLRARPACRRARRAPCVVTYGDVPLLTADDPAPSCSTRTPRRGNAVTVLTAVARRPHGLRPDRARRRRRGRARSSSRRTPTDAELRDPRDQLRRLRLRRRRPARRARRAWTPTTPRASSTSPTSLGHRARRGRPGRRRRRRRRAGRSRASTTGSSSPRSHRELNRRTVERWMRAGVTVVDPATTWIDADVDARARRTLLEPNIQLRGATTVATGATVGPDTHAASTPWSATAPRSSRTPRSTAPRSGPRRRSARTPTCGPAPGSAAGAKAGASSR